MHKKKLKARPHIEVHNISTMPLTNAHFFFYTTILHSILMAELFLNFNLVKKKLLVQYFHYALLALEQSKYTYLSVILNYFESA